MSIPDPDLLAAIREIVASELDKRNLKRSPDKTAAERMRKYRAQKAKSERNVTSPSKRNAPVENAVTLRNGHSNITLEVWDAYSTAYQERYRAAPVRNAKVNGQLVQLAKRVGPHAAPMAGWFVSHGAARYVQSGHSIGMLLMDAEKLHTEWMTGRRGTATQAAQSDRTQATGDVFHKLIEEVKRDGKIA